MPRNPSIIRRSALTRTLVLLLFACNVSHPHTLLADNYANTLKIGSVPPGTVAAPFELTSLDGKSANATVCRETGGAQLLGNLVWTL